MALTREDTRTRSAADLAAAELLAEVRAGDRAAFGVLFERHRGLAHGYARRFAPWHADDVVSEAMTAILNAIDRGHGPIDSFRPYLLTAIRRKAQAHHASRELAGEVFEEADPLDITAALDQQGTPLVDAFADLPERWRHVPVWFHLDGEPLADVAARLGLSPNATSALLYRARAGLRAAYLERLAA